MPHNCPHLLGHIASSTAPSAFLRDRPKGCRCLAGWPIVKVVSRGMLPLRTPYFSRGEEWGSIIRRYRCTIGQLAKERQPYRHYPVAEGRSPRPPAHYNRSSARSAPISNVRPYSIQLPRLPKAGRRGSCVEDRPFLAGVWGCNPQASFLSLGVARLLRN